MFVDVRSLNVLDVATMQQCYNVLDNATMC